MERVDLKKLERNVFRDYLQDGLFDMIVGTFFLLVGVPFLNSSAGSSVVVWVVWIIIVAPLLLRGLKKRYTYPRTGYVELRQGDPQVLPWMILGSLVLGLAVLVAVLIAAGVLARPAQWYRWMPIFFCIWLAGIFLGLGQRVGAVRYYVVASLMLAMGPVSALLPLEGKLANLGLFLTAVGAVLLAWGAVGFAWFLRKHPLPADGATDVTC